MKKWLAIFLAILVAFAVIIPAAADDPTPTAAPTSAPPSTIHVSIEINSYYGSGVDSGHVQCTTIEGGFYDVTTTTPVTFDTWSFTCLGQVTLTEGYTIWSIPGGSQGGDVSQGGLRAVLALLSGTIYYDSYYQDNSNTTGDADWNGPYLLGNGSATSYQLPGNVAIFGGYGRIQTPSPDAGVELTPYFYIHASVKAPCGQDYQKVSTVDQGTIAATAENGVGPESLTVGAEYELTVWGGPWNDGTTDRHDTAVKINSEDWTTLSDWATNWLGPQCTQGDPLDPTKTTVLFTAWETDPSMPYDWSIRVNDITGQFADNTGGMNYELDQVQAKVATNCSDQYLAGAAIGSGTIPANSEAGILALATDGNTTTTRDTTVGGINVPVTDTIGPGSWIKIITSGGPWQAGSGGPGRYDVAMKNPDATWSELTGDAATACSTQSGNYVTAYVQIPINTGIYLRVNDATGSFSDNTGSMSYAIYATTYSPVPPTGCAETFKLGSLLKVVTVPATSQSGMSVGNLSSNDTDVTGSTGGQVDLRYYAIETSGIWYNGSTPETWGGIASDNSTTTPPASSAWSNLQTAPGVVCAVPLDPVGHIRVYLPLNLIVNYWLRVQEVGTAPNWADNSGSLTFSIYEASQLKTPEYTTGTMPDATGCDSTYTKGAASSTIHIYSNNDAGVTLPDFTSGHIYAIETTLGPWSNNGTNSYEVAISVDNGASWTNLVAYASALCAESPDGNHLLVFFQALAGRTYKLRVYDPGNVYSDNTGSIGIILYDNVTSTVNPWGSCSGNYILSQITVANTTIPTTGISILTGLAGPPVTIGDIQPGKTYAIEISNGSWWYQTTLPGTHYYASQISKDNGSYWDSFGPSLTWATCVVQTNQSTVTDQKIYRVYFTAGTSSYQMRISAADLDAAVSGNLNYILYSTVPSNTQTPVTNPVTTVPPIVPPAWDIACYESFLRPSGLFEDVNFQLPSISFGTLGTITFPNIPLPLPAIDSWISYLEWSVRSFFAWCPDDTAALGAIPTTLAGYEPFGTINDTVVIFKTLENNVTALQSSGGEGQNFAPYSVVFGAGGGQGSGGWQGILPVLGTDSPWLGGKLKWGNGSDTGGASGGESPITALPAVPSAPGISSTSQAYDDYCQTIMLPHLGASASVGLCGALTLAKTAPLIWVLIQLLSDVGSIMLFIQYIQRKWIDAGASG